MEETLKNLAVFAISVLLAFAGSTGAFGQSVEDLSGAYECSSDDAFRTIGANFTLDVATSSLDIAMTGWTATFRGTVTQRYAPGQFVDFVSYTLSVGPANYPEVRRERSGLDRIFKVEFTDFNDDATLSPSVTLDVPFNGTYMQMECRRKG